MARAHAGPVPLGSLGSIQINPTFLPLPLDPNDPLKTTFHWSHADQFVKEEYNVLKGNNIDTSVADSLYPAAGDDSLHDITQGSDAASKNREIRDGQWRTVLTIGDGTCLIHAILMCISPSYRKIPNERATIGQLFRTKIISRFFDGKMDDGTNVRIDQRNSLNVKKDKTDRTCDFIFDIRNGYLSDYHLRKISESMFLNFFVIVRDSHRGTVDAALYEFSSNAPYIFIYNNEPSHYSAIQLVREDRFMLTLEEFIERYPFLTADIKAEAIKTLAPSPGTLVTTDQIVTTHFAKLTTLFQRSPSRVFPYNESCHMKARLQLQQAAIRPAPIRAPGPAASQIVPTAANPLTAAASRAVQALTSALTPKSSKPSRTVGLGTRVASSAALLKRIQDFKAQHKDFTTFSDEEIQKLIHLNPALNAALKKEADFDTATRLTRQACKLAGGGRRKKNKKTKKHRSRRSIVKKSTRRK